MAGRKKKTDFQRQQEQAAAGGGADDMESMLSSLLNGGGGGGDLAKLQDMWTEALKDPAIMKQMEGMGEEYVRAMEQLAKMTPEELEQQMQDAMRMLTDDSMVESVLAKKEEVLAQLEATKAVPPEELARLKVDDEYFEAKMRDSFAQMQGVFTNPDYLKMASQAMGSMKDLMDGEGTQALNDLTELLKSVDFDDPAQVELARQKLLESDNPLLVDMFAGDGMSEIIGDPEKFRETVQQGANVMKGEL